MAQVLQDNEQAVREAAASTSTDRAHGTDGSDDCDGASPDAVPGSANEFVDYAAAKGGVDTLTIGLSREVAGDGIRVNGVRPGLIATDIHADSDAGRLDRLVASVPMQRIGSAEEVATAIVWLLSDEAGYCTGTTINISGGR